MKTKKAAALCLALLMLISFGGCKKTHLFKKSKTAPLSVSLGYVHFDDGLKSIYVKNKDRFTKTIAPTYGMSEEQASDLVKNEKNYGVFTIDTTIANKEKTGYTFAKIEANGEHDGIWLCGKSVNGQVGVPAGSTTNDFVISFVADTAKLDAAAIYNTLAALTFSVYFYETPENDEDVVDEGEYGVLTARNAIAPPDSAENGNGIEAAFESIEDGDDYANLYRSDKNGLALYGYPDAVADRFAAKGSGWECYLLNIKVKNDSGDEIIFYGNTVAQNGAGGIWVAPKSVDGDEVGISAGMDTTLAFLLLVDPSVAGGATIADTVKSMNLSLQYSVERTDVDQIETCLRVPNTIPMAAK